MFVLKSTDSEADHLQEFEIEKYLKCSCSVTLKSKESLRSAKPMPIKAC